MLRKSKIKEGNYVSNNQKAKFIDGYANRENQLLEPANTGQEPTTTYQEHQLCKN